MTEELSDKIKPIKSGVELAREIIDYAIEHPDLKIGELAGALNTYIRDNTPCPLARGTVRDEAEREYPGYEETPKPASNFRDDRFE
jgi:hypothetical protein